MQRFKTVINTRPSENQEELSDQLSMMGYDVVAAPMMKYEAVEYTQPNFNHYDAIVISSLQAFKVFKGKIPTSIPLFVVGEHTADVIAEEDHYKIAAVGENMSKLVTKLKKAYHTKRKNPDDIIVLYLSGEDINYDPYPRLENTRIQMDRSIVYRAALKQIYPLELLQLLIRQEKAAVVFLSKRTAVQFTKLAEQYDMKYNLKFLTAYCFSKKIASSLGKRTYRDVQVAPKSDLTMLLGMF